MKREDFEAQVADFVRTCCQEYNDGSRYEMGPSEEGEEPSATIIIEMQGEYEYRIPVGVTQEYYSHGSGGYQDVAGINTWEDNYLTCDAESLYAWLWLETVKRLRKERDEHREHHDSRPVVTKKV